MKNLSSLGATAFSALSTAFQSELQARGVKLMAGETAVAVIVSITQSPTEYLGVAQIHKKDDPITLMESLGAVTGPGAPEIAPNLTLHRELLFEQDRPMLDVVFAGDGQLAFVLGAAEISSYQLRDGKWMRSGVELLPRRRAAERNERGYLFFGKDLESASFSGEICQIFATAGRSWSCQRTRGEEAPIRAVSDADLAGKNVGRWLSGARLEADEKTQIVLTGTDGLARLYEERAEPSATFFGWGSEIAALHSACGGGSGWQLLRTTAADWTKTDSVQAVDIREKQVTSVSAPMEFPGAITALHTPGTWTTASTASNDKAVAVVRNLQTGLYEAYLLTIRCAN